MIAGSRHWRTIGTLSASLAMYVCDQMFPSAFRSLNLAHFSIITQVCNVLLEGKPFFARDGRPFCRGHAGAAAAR